MSYPWQLALGLNTPTTVSDANGRIQMPDPANLDIFGGNPGDVLQTDGAGGLRWVSFQASTTVGWDSITGKPDTFPPTVPIAWNDVVHPSTFPPTLPIPISGVSGLQAALDAKASLPIAQSDVTGLVADLALKAPLASPFFTGDPRAPNPAPNDNDNSIATTSWVKALGYQAGNQTITISGDASGSGATSIALTVTRLQTQPVSATAPSQDQVLQWNGSAWTPTLLSIPGGTITGITAGTGLSGGGTSGNVTLGIANDGVTNALLAPMPTLTLKGNNTGATADPVDLTVAQVMTLLGAAPLANPVFTGDPRAPTPAAADNDTSIATTAWVTAKGYGTGTLTGLSGDVLASGSGVAAAQVVALQGRNIFNVAPTDGQVLQWSLSGNRWQPATIGGAGTVTSISAGTGVTVSPSPITGAGSVSLTVPVTAALGGTGLTTYAQGDLIYASAANALAVLPKTTTTPRYLSNSGASQAPAWSAIDLALGVTGVLPIANGGTGASTAAAGPFVQKAGDTMTGGLTISPAGQALMILNKNASGSLAGIYGQTAGSTRWVLQLGDQTPESSGAGSNLIVQRYNDAGTLLDTPFSINRLDGTAIFNASPEIRGAWAALTLIKPASGTGCYIQSKTGALLRWQMGLGDAAAEGGSNAGSNFGLARFNDAGTYVDTPFSINRNTGYFYVNTPYIYLYGSGNTGAVYGSGGPLLYADPNSVMLKLGSGTGGFYFQDYSGNTCGGFDSAGWVLSTGGRRAIKNDGTYCYLMNEQQAPSVFITSTVNYYRSAIHSFQDAAANTWVKIDGGGLTTFINQGAIFIGGNANFYLQNAGDQTLYANNGYTCSHIYTKSNGYYSWGVNSARSFISIYGGVLQNDAAPCAGYGAYINNSDERMKFDIADLDRGIDTLMKLKPVEYTRKEPDRGDKDGPTPYPGPWHFRRELGFLAQDLMDDLPEAVVELPHGIAGIDKFEGSNLPPLGIQSEMILAVAVRAIQQLQAEIETLKARLN